MTATHDMTTTPHASEATRWGQLIFGIICMVMTANLQYGWTLFVNPIDSKYHWGRAAIQVAFSIFVLTETWLVPFEGYLIDKFGPSLMVSLSGALIAAAWVINSYADSLTLLYLGVFTMALAYGLFYVGLRTTTGSSAVIATLLEPVTATVVAALFLDERLGALGVVGTLLILAAVAGLGREEEPAAVPPPA